MVKSGEKLIDSKPEKSTAYRNTRLARIMLDERH